MPNAESSAPTAAPSPPLDPQADLDGSTGLRVAPYTRFEESGWAHSSEMFVFPTRIAPASRSRATAGASDAAVSTGRRREASQPGRPAVSIASLTVNGTPCSGPG